MKQYSNRLAYYIHVSLQVLELHAHQVLSIVHMLSHIDVLKRSPQTLSLHTLTSEIL